MPSIQIFTASMCGTAGTSFGSMRLGGSDATACRQTLCGAVRCEWQGGLRPSDAQPWTKLAKGPMAAASKACRNSCTARAGIDMTLMAT